MVGLGSSCRGMKSPPLLMAALVACIIVLGFNYWIASSRSMDLQAILLSNITVNDRLIQNLREHLKELQTEYGKLQLDVYWFQKNQTNLQRKFSYDLSQCINQMKELKEQCEERIDELTKKGSDVPQIKENKEFSEDSKKYSQVNIQLPALKQTEVKHADLEQQKPSEDVPKVVPTLRQADLMQAKERIDGPADIRKQEPKAEEEQLFSQLKKPQDSFKAAAGHKEMLPESEKEPNPSENKKHAAGQDALQPAPEQAASEEIEREQLLNYDAKQDDLSPGKADKQEHEAMNQDKDVDYNLDENEAESETDKQAALAGIENVQNPEDMKNHLSDLGEGRQKL
ncbi:Golgi membrane protein 1 isoform X3 [Myiozetetes cayanensis]|uniref:Golgi membrane protein 1 isoform X3 n=1 Tax=Myiozetetes cayanensis TaxID=478635 RepID=UPI00215EDD0E|nr:Golgi membrane protein 1 isoform X3 [Myiozetetes cayanensis]